LGGKWLGGLAAFVVVAVACGIASSAMLLPVVEVSSAVAGTGQAIIDELPDELTLPELSQKSYLLAADGTQLTTFYSQNRVVVGLNEISQHMQDAVIALEDRRFWEHSGVDVLGMARAFLSNSTSVGASTQGASTLTQQYVKNALIEKAVAAGDNSGVDAATDQTYARKLREAKMAVALEREHGKKKVLEGYLNIAQFGPSQWGVEAAAMYYFGVHASELTIVQSATIAAVTQRPNGLDPVNFPEANQARRDVALAAMLREGYITQDEYTEAVGLNVTDTLNITEPQGGCETADSLYLAGFFCDFVVAEILHSEAFGADADERKALLDGGGLTVTTTLDVAAQANAFNAINDQVPIDNTQGVAQALTSVEPGTGRIIAMAQNRYYKSGTTEDPLYTSVNYNADLRYGGSSGFQPGSTFKPFILAAWLEAGHSLQEAFDASKTTYSPAYFKASCVDGGRVGQAKPWSFRGGAAKSVNAYTATQNSMNAAYVAMEYKLDMCDVQDVIGRLGVSRADGADWSLEPSMVLGTNEVSPLAMAGAYAAFASGGTYCKPTSIDAVTKADGTALELPDKQCSQAISPAIANGVTAALRRVISYGTGTAARLADGREAAGKTGTTDNAKAAWFCGYTPQLATAIWTGYPDRQRDMGTYGGTIAAPVFRNFMSWTLDGAEKLSFESPPQEVERGKPVPVPKVLGLEEKKATETLQEAGFFVEIGEGIHSSTVPLGVVMEQDPRGSAYPGTTITLELSLGPEPAPPPPLETESPPPVATG
jgi:membrane peptidoglycan carboxypeptidase